VIAITHYDISPGLTSRSIAIAIHEETDGTNTNDDRAQTGMANANITECKYWRQGGTVTSITTSDLTNLNDAYSSGGFKEAGVGWYRLDLPNAAIAAGGANWVIVWIKTDTKNGKGSVRINLTGAPADIIAIDGSVITGSGHITGAIPADVVAWKNFGVPTPDTAGYPKSTIKSGTGTGEISLTAGLVVLQDGSITTAKFAGNAITAAVIADNAIDRATFAADTGLQTVRSGLCQSGSTSTTIKLDSGASATNQMYRFLGVKITGGTGVGQPPMWVIDYNGTSKVATVLGTWLVTPDNTSTFALLDGLPYWCGGTLI
jgi:hypothetical protein